MSSIESNVTETRVFPPADAVVKKATISGMAAYEALCKEADQDYAGYWARLAREHITWKTPFTKSLDDSKAPFYQWFADGTLNVSYNCLDRNIEAGLGDKVAIIFEADGGQANKVTYKDLLSRVSRFANALRAQGIKKGDRVLIYMPMSVEGVVAMQACARIGAIHSVVFGGFSAKSVQERIQDAGAVADVELVMDEAGQVLAQAALVPTGVALRTEEHGALVVVHPVDGVAEGGKINADFRADEARGTGDEECLGHGEKERVSQTGPAGTFQPNLPGGLALASPEALIVMAA